MDFLLNAITRLEPVLDNPPQLLGLGVAGIFNLQIAPFCNDFFCSKRPLGVSPPGVAPPFLDSFDIVEVDLVFLVNRESHDRGTA